MMFIRLPNGKIVSRDTIARIEYTVNDDENTGIRDFGDGKIRIIFKDSPNELFDWVETFEEDLATYSLVTAPAGYKLLLVSGDAYTEEDVIAFAIHPFGSIKRVPVPISALGGHTMSNRKALIDPAGRIYEYEADAYFGTIDDFLAAGM